MTGPTGAPASRPLLAAAGVAFALLGIVAASGGRQSPALDVRDPDGGGRLLATIELGEPARFTLLFTHSMYGGDVAETYQLVRSGPAAPSLLRSTVRTAAGGAADYYARYGNVRRDGAGWIVEASPLALPRLRLVVDRVGAPRLQVGEREVPLLSIVGDGQIVELRPTDGRPR